MKKPSLFAVFIAYNAEKKLEDFYTTFPKHLFDEIILVDDASQDGTYELAKKLGIRSYRNETNLGYGGNMKRALSIALSLGGEVFVDIHPDGEYLPSCIPDALREIDKGVECVLGNRFSKKTDPLQSGMYIWKYPLILFLNLLPRLIFRKNIKDFHQGFRVYTRKMLEKINFEQDSNGYLFSFEIIAQAIFHHIPIAQVPVETSYTGEKRGASLKHCLFYSIGIFQTLVQYLLAKMGITTKIFACPKKNRLFEPVFPASS